MNKIKFGLVTIVMSLGLLSSMISVKAASAAGIGDIFQEIYHLFNGLFQGALPLILFLFVIVLVLGLFTSPLWLKKVFGWTK